jgi:hypothetical protein
MKCTLCETRRPRRYCPGIRADICALCCGTSREVTVDCPFSCEYLREAREHERDRRPEIPENPPQAHTDIKITERWLEENEPLVMMGLIAVFRAATETAGAVDQDAIEALDALVRTYRTRETGLVYDSRPTNPVAGAIYDGIQRHINEIAEALKQRTGVSSLRDADVLGALVFAARSAIARTNGRRRGRAFLDYIRTELNVPAESAPTSSLIV